MVGGTWLQMPRTRAPRPVRIGQDANIFVAEFGGKGVEPLPVKANRQAYVLCLEGENLEVSVGAEVVFLNQHDAMEVRGPVEMGCQVEEGGMAHMLVVEMAA